MTITATVSEIEYAGDGVSTAFSVPFVFDTSADLKVVRTDTDGNAVELSTGYSVTGGGGSTGTVTLSTALASGYTLTISDDPDLTQPVDYVANDDFPAESHEDALDRGVRISKRILQIVKRALRTTDGDPSGESEMLLPSVQSRKGKVLGFNATTGAPEMVASVTSVGSLSASIIGGFLYVQTTAESAAGVTPTLYQYPPGDLRRYGAVGDGTTNDSTAVSAAFSVAQDVLVLRGLTFNVTGVSIPVGNRRVYGGGTFKKHNATVEPMFSLGDGISGLHFDGVAFNGQRSLFSSGNAAPAMLGHVIPDIRVTDCYFYDVIDVGIKLRDGAGLYAAGNRFYNIGQNGIELRHYSTDPRTGLAYVTARPAVQGGHRIIGNHFWRIDDGNSGAGDGCGVTFDSASASHPVDGVVIEGNNFVDVLRSIWSENNVAGGEARNVTIRGNTIRGNVAGSATVETKDGIGLIGVRNFSVTGNTILNVGNFTPSGGDCAGIQVSNTTTQDGVIADNTIIDDTGNAVRTDYGINVAAGTRIIIRDNVTRGASINQINLQATATEIDIGGNRGAEAEYSWGAVVPFMFSRQNIPANTANIQAYPCGLTDWDEVPVPSGGRLVGVSVLLSAAVAAGTITFKIYSDGVQRTNLNVTEADFGGGVQATVRIAAGDGVSITTGRRLRVYMDTNAGFLPTTTDALVTLFFDTSVKE